MIPEQDNGDGRKGQRNKADRYLFCQVALPSDARNYDFTLFRQLGPSGGDITPIPGWADRHIIDAHMRG